MWDNRIGKRNPKAPDFKCRDRTCDGLVWPGSHSVPLPIVAPGGADRRVAREEQSASSETAHVASADSGAASRSPARRPLRDVYLELTDFVLANVRSRYEAAGLPCSDATVAAAVATLFISTCRGGGPG